MAAITPAHLCVTLLIYMWAFAPISSSEDHVHERHSAGKTLTEEGKDEGVQDGGSKAGKVGAITSVALFVVFGVAFLLQQKRKLQAEQPAANEAEALNTGA
ncbi:Hypothetical predicted protein [Scomber scombrus]|uniref:Uncharacterized protein n=1 Tax=Scomber scombrus TaxID=13677 RepID=A0AAV1QGJ9_SCOSC